MTSHEGRPTLVPGQFAVLAADPRTGVVLKQPDLASEKRT